MSVETAYVPFPSFIDWINEGLRYSADDIEGALAEFKDVPKSIRQVAIQSVRDAAAIETGAIEKLYEVDRGITITAAVQSAQLEAALANHDERAKSLIAAQMGAYDFVLDLVTGTRPIAQAWIRELHQQLCSAQKTYKAITPTGEWAERPLIAGSYKSEPNHVRTSAGTIHHYAPVHETESEMARLLDELRSDVFAGAHPVDQISFSHYALVAIHPFTDGNGRVARAFSSIFCYKRYSVPLLITADQRTQYFSALSEADSGRFTPFRSFINARVTQSIRLMVSSMQTAQLGSADHRVRMLKRVYETRGGYLQVDIDEAAHSLLNEVKRQLEIEIERLRTQFAGMHISVSDVQSSRESTSPNHRRVVRYGPRQVRIQAGTHSPAEATVIMDIDIEVPKDATPTDTFRVLSSSAGLVLELPTEEMLPERAVLADVELALFVGRALAATLRELEHASLASIRQKGYSVGAQ